jgi:hypothetical protein
VLQQHRNKCFDNFEILNKASRDLYEECQGCHKEHTVLWMTLELLKLKASNGWSDSSFSALLELLSKVLPKSNGLATSTYLAKKIICPLTLTAQIMLIICYQIELDNLNIYETLMCSIPKMCWLLCMRFCIISSHCLSLSSAELSAVREERVDKEVDVL